MHASLIEGGVELSSYPATCTLALERRTLPGETGEQIERELETLLQRCRAADPEFEASQRTLLVREPFEIGQEEELVTLVAAAAAEVLPGARARSAAPATGPTPRSSPPPASRPSSSAPAARARTPIEEWVSLSDTEAVARTLVGVAARFCA